MLDKLSQKVRGAAFKLGEKRTNYREISQPPSNLSEPDSATTGRGQPFHYSLLKGHPSAVDVEAGQLVAEVIVQVGELLSSWKKMRVIEDGRRAELFEGRRNCKEGAFSHCIVVNFY